MFKHRPSDCFKLRIVTCSVTTLTTSISTVTFSDNAPHPHDKATYSHARVTPLSFVEFQYQALSIVPTAKPKAFGSLEPTSVHDPSRTREVSFVRARVYPHQFPLAITCLFQLKPASFEFISNVAKQGISTWQADASTYLQHDFYL